MVLRLTVEQFTRISSTSRLLNIGYLGEGVGGIDLIQLFKKNLNKKKIPIWLPCGLLAELELVP